MNTNYGFESEFVQGLLGMKSECSLVEEGNAGFYIVASNVQFFVQKHRMICVIQ